MIVREIAVAPDVLGLARRWRGSSRPRGARERPRGAPRDERRAIRLRRVRSDRRERRVGARGRARPTRGGRAFPAAPRWIGVIPYEAGRGLERAAWRPRRGAPAPPLVRPRWHRYDAVARIDRGPGGRDRGRLGAAAERLARARAPRPAGEDAVDARSLRPDDETGRPRTSRASREVLRLIAEGDVYQVEPRAVRGASALRGDRSMCSSRSFKGAPAPYGFLCRFRRSLGLRHQPRARPRGARRSRCAPRPSRARGRAATTRDATWRSRASSTATRRSAPSSRWRSISTATISARRRAGLACACSARRASSPGARSGAASPRSSRAARPDAALDAIARAILPCGSVTGAPKVRAMEIIAELEPFRRGLYTGAYGYVGRDGALVLAMAIRTLEISAGWRARATARAAASSHGSDPLARARRDALEGRAARPALAAKRS